MKITGYTILDKATDMDLINVVNEYIDKGWQPLGGVSVTSVITDVEISLTEEHFYQAMVLEDDN
jgi:hypothetical protein